MHAPLLVARIREMLVNVWGVTKVQSLEAVSGFLQVDGGRLWVIGA